MTNAARHMVGRRTPPVDKAVLLLRALDQETREQVLGRMSEDVRSAVESRIGETGSTPSDALGGSIAERRRMMRETLLAMHQRTSAQVSQVTNAIDDQAGRGLDGMDPLDQLADVHPAAIARALQGERPEAWAVVVDRMSDVSRSTLLAWLDGNARAAIDAARRTQSQLPPQLRATAERAIRQTIVPRALREHELLMTSPMPGSSALVGR